MFVHVAPGVPMVSLKKCSQFGSAVWPAILNKNFADFMKKIHKSNFIRANIWKFDHSWTFTGVPRGPTKKLDPISSVVLTFIGYKQTEKHGRKAPIKPSINIDGTSNYVLDHINMYLLYKMKAGMLDTINSK